MKAPGEVVSSFNYFRRRFCFKHIRRDCQQIVEYRNRCPCGEDMPRKSVYNRHYFRNLSCHLNRIWHLTDADPAQAKKRIPHMIHGYNRQNLTNFFQVDKKNQTKQITLQSWGSLRPPNKNDIGSKSSQMPTNPVNIKV